jgi:LysM repeat protein
MGNSIGPTGAGQTSAVSTQNADTQSTTVMVGETKLSQIAERLGIPLQELITANPNINPGNVNAGQELKLPVKTDTQTAQAPVTQEARVTQQTQTKPQTRELDSQERCASFSSSKCWVRSPQQSPQCSMQE